MARHTYNLEGGEELTTMGATWFVSYCWYNLMDKKHTNWQLVSTYRSRISVFNRTKQLHKFWLEQITQMGINNLNQNTIGLKGQDVINMSIQLLKII